MHKQKISWFAVLFLLCVSFKSYAQISANPVVGCGLLQTNLTGISGATSATWNPGNGGNFSTLLNPSFTYTVPNTYNISYTAIVGGTPTTAVISVTVFPNPTGSFNSSIPPNNHCSPMTATFTAGSSVPNATFTFFFDPISQLTTTSTVVTHVYNSAPMSYTPKLQVTDNNGCSSALINGAIINVSLPPSLVINPPSVSSCSLSQTVPFSSNGSTGNSPTSSALTYNWSFVGTGNVNPSTSSAPNPTVTFGQGEYTVTLIGTDNNSCRDTVTAVVSVLQPSVTATVPSVVCMNAPINVTVNSLPSITTWQMGNSGGQAIAIDNNASGPSVTTLNLPPATNIPFTYGVGSGGTKTITVTASLGTCNSIITKVITVEEVTPQFTFAPNTPTISCSSPMIISILNQSSVNTISGNPLNYSWELNTYPLPITDHIHPSSGVTLTPTNSVNPTFTLTQGSSNPYVVYQTHQPHINLFATSQNGCKAAIGAYYWNLQRPTAWFNKDKREGCAPLVVTYRDSSRFLPFNPPSFAISSYTWNNGANPPTIQSGTTSPTNNYNVPSFTYTYTSSGTYTPYLIIETFGGCVDTSFIDTVIVSTPPNISINVAPNLSVCAGVTPVTVSLQAAPGQTVQHWHVTSDKGFYSGCVTNPTPSFPFTHTGVFNFTVTGTQNGCAAPPVVSSQSVTVFGPYGKFRFQTYCANTSSVNFYSYLQDVQTATLNFGDGTFQTYTGNVGGTASFSSAHIYSPTATVNDYTVSLVSVNPARPCAQQTYTQVVHIRHAQAVITNSLGQPLPSLPTALACTRDTIRFSAATSTDVAAWCQDSDYSWFFYPPNPSQSLPVSVGHNTAFVRILSAGVYTVMLRVRDINGCQNTDTKLFRVSSANPTFTFNSNPICLSNNPVQVINSTSQVSPDYNVNFWWDFGDLSPIITTTSMANVSHSYSNILSPSGTRFVKLVAQNNVGCRDTIIHPLTINNPDPSFVVSNPAVCVPETVTFTALGVGYSSYKINYSDSTGALTKPNNVFKHKFTNPGNPVVTLTVTDAAGCVNSSTIQYITARVKPSASFTTILGPNGLCAPATITLVSTSTTADTIYSSITNYIWYFGPVSAVTSSTSVVHPFDAGVTTVSMIAFPSGAGVACTDTASTIISVYNTQGTLVLNKTKFCLGGTLTTSLTAVQDVANWVCDFDFGNVSTTKLPTQLASYTYTNTGVANIIATMYSPQNSCKRIDTKTVEIIRLNPEFTILTDTVHCLRIADQYTPGVNTAPNTSVTYNWTFGDGNSVQNDPNPSHTYTAAGVWPVILTVNAPDFNCKVSSAKNITVNPLPVVVLSVGEDNCANLPFVINAGGSQGISSGTWTAPPTGTIIPTTTFVTTQSTFSTNAVASATGEFSLSVTDNNGCVSDVVAKNIYIIPSIEPSVWDTTIVIGQTVQLNANMGSDYTYTWSPMFTHLSCEYCTNPISSTTINTTYSVLIEDTHHCDTITNTFMVIVKPVVSVDVPTAFTPNGDGVNDKIYVEGWGIKKLNYFRIYNRWGQLLFETDDLEQGWDGTFNGVQQNVETYVYQVSVQSYIDEKPTEKKGTFKLLR